MKKKQGKSNLVVSGLLDYLSETGQVKLLPEVAEELHSLLEESKKADQITVTSFLPLTQIQQSELKNILEELIKIDLPIKNQIDKKLLGGFTVKVGDWFLDSSLLYYLNNIKRLLLS